MSGSTHLRDWRRLALVLGGEGMQSGLHFGLNLALMTLLPAKEYGTFAFVLVLGGVGLVYIRALTAMPAATYIGRARRPAYVDFYEGAFGAAALGISATVAIVAAGILSVYSEGAAWAGGAVVGLWSLRSHLRTIGIAKHRLLPVTFSDAVFAIVGASASAVALRLAEDPLAGVLFALALANLVGAVALAFAMGAAPRFDFGRRARRFYGVLGRRLIWSLYSVTAALVQGQGVAFLVVAFAGPAAFAPIAAMLAFFSPLRIFSLSLSNMLQPDIARVAASGDVAHWRQMRLTWTARASIVGLVYGEIGFLVIPRLHMKSLGHQPVVLIAACAWALFMTLLLYVLPRSFLEAQMRYRDIAVVTTLGAIASLTVTTALLFTGPPSYAILGALLGEAVAAAATWKMAARPFGLRQNRASREPAPGVLEPSAR